MKLADQVDYSGERPGLTKLDLEGASLCRFTVQYTIITIWKEILRLQCPVQEDFPINLWSACQFRRLALDLPIPLKL